MEQLRIFLALDLPQTERRAIIKNFQKLDLNFINLKVPKPENLHLTLRFWSHFPTVKLDSLMQTAEQMADSGPDNVLPFDKPVIYGGQQARALVLQSSDDQQLQTFYQDFNQQLAEAEVANSDGRIFRPHLTLARIKYHFSNNDRQIFTDWSAKFEARFEALTIYESRLTAMGPVYTPLKSFPL